MKFYNFDIVFQEIPDEVSLAVNITNCPNRCPGCHSPHLWEDTGESLTAARIDQWMKDYVPMVTCFCFMGGDGETEELWRLARHIRQRYPVKIAWYSGRTEIPPQPERGLFDYIKVGPYIQEKGGLKAVGTNQHLYAVNAETGALKEVSLHAR